MNDEGTLSFATAIDTSGYEEGMQYIEERTTKAAESVEVESEKIKELLSFPTANVDINLVTSQNIDEVANSINSVISLNEKGVKQLQQQYDQLARKMGEAYMQGNDKEYLRLKQQCDAINSTISARKKAIKEAQNLNDELDSVAAKIEKETKAQNESNAAQEAAGTHTQSLRARMRELKMELVELEAAGERGTEHYKAVQEEVANLTDAWGDAQQQATILANDEKGMQGIISGLNGLSGAASVATGTMALFGSENEDLNKIMLRVQSLMGITIGLQQVQQTLNKDSAFSLVTLNGLKEYWNKLVAIAAGEEATEAAAQTAETAAATASATANTAEAAAKQAVAGASAENAVAEGVDATAKGANAVASSAATAANITLAGAFRAVGAAIMSIPVFGWIAAGLTALIAVIAHFVSAANEESEKLEEQEELLKDGRKAYLETEVAIGNYINQINRFNGTAAQEKKLVQELNNKYGESIGFHKTLREWKAALETKGKALCQVMLLEAQAQAVLNKYTEAYINLLEVKDKAEKGEYDHWYNTKAGDEESRKEAIAEAQAGVDQWETQYKKLQEEIADFKDKNDIGMHIDPASVSTSSSNGGGSSASTGNGKSAWEVAHDQEQAIKSWRDAMKKYIRDAQLEVSQYTIDMMAEGQVKEINSISKQTYEKKQAWEDQIAELAKVRMQADKDYYMSQNGATEEGYSKTANGKKSLEDYIKALKDDPEIGKQYAEVLAKIEEQGQQQQAAVREKYRNALIDEFGTTEQKIEKLAIEWQKKISFMPEEFSKSALDKMDAEFAALYSQDFKNSINWDDVFGDLDKQATGSLQFTLQKIQEYFKSNKESMSTDEIKEYTEAIKQMEDEIASRNPFSQLHKSIQDISTAKDDLVNALNELASAQSELNAATQERNAAMQEYNDLLAQVESGTLAANDQKLIDAETRLAAAKAAVTKATKNTNSAEQKTLTARNNITAGYKNFASSLKSVGSQVTSVGKDAKNLAACFSKDVANGIGKAIDVVDTILNATTNVIDSLADTSKSVGSTITGTAEAAGQATKSTATATATAISTVEKASVILAVISAALQIATAIANLFNNDDKLQEDIDALQDQIDHLQWELDNMEAVRLEETMGNTFEKITELMSQATDEVVKLHLACDQYGDAWSTWLTRLTYSSDIYEKQIEKIADAYASVDYTADKALGSDKWDSARSQLENYAQQMVLIRKQISDEEDKKDSDESAIISYKEKLSETAEAMASVINDMIEGIIGGSASDIATQLGDAFFDACEQGEDAMEAWADAANDIIKSVLKQMLVSKFLEEPLGQIFDKYRKKWFGDDGTFAGIDSVINSMTQFSSDLDAVGESFSQIWDSLPSSITDMFAGDEEREGTSKGIATASQESVDENNARLTTIQGHTYTLVQGLTELNVTANTMLQRLTGIETNTGETNDKLDTMQAQIRQVRDGIDDLNTKGIKLKS